MNNKEKLNKKIEKEYTNFIDSMEKKSNKEIINSAYEIVVKEEIKNNLENVSLGKFQTETLLKQANLLNEFYKRWSTSSINKDKPYFYTGVIQDIQQLTREKTSTSDELAVLLEELKMNLADIQQHYADYYTFEIDDTEKIIEYLEQLEVIKENRETER